MCDLSFCFKVFKPSINEINNNIEFSLNMVNQLLIFLLEIFVFFKVIHKTFNSLNHNIRKENKYKLVTTLNIKIDVLLIFL